MNIDDLLKKRKRLNVPDTLWQKIEKGIATEAQGQKTPRFMKWLPDLMHNRKPAWAMAAMAAALILTMRFTLAPEIVIDQEPKDDTAEINQFIDETLGSVFTYNYDFDSNSVDNSDNSALSLQEGLDNILWINGGDNA